MSDALSQGRTRKDGHRPGPIRSAPDDPTVHPGEHGVMAAAVANAMVKLHKEQFGRGPTHAKAMFAGADVLVCVLEDALLPSERRMVEIGQKERVRDTRISFQAATADEFKSAVE